MSRLLVEGSALILFTIGPKISSTQHECMLLLKLKYMDFVKQ